MKKEKKIILDDEEVTLLDDEESDLLLELLQSSSFNSKKGRFSIIETAVPDLPLTEKRKEKRENSAINP